MGMATFTDDLSVVEGEFSHIEKLLGELRREHPELAGFKELSIGMSGDYKIALAHGATMVRIGSKIFGPRPAVKQENQ